MMQGQVGNFLNNLPASIQKRGKRVGRGVGSGKGVTAGMGMKGQKARGKGTPIGFEGGQTPTFRRLPKRGMVGWNKKFNRSLVVNGKFLKTTPSSFEEAAENFRASFYHQRIKIIGLGENNIVLERPRSRRGENPFSFSEK